MKISIIIPVLNEACNLDKLLPHLKKAGGDTLAEIIVSDAESTDYTEKVCSGHGVIFSKAAQKGRAAQMNHGAALATGNVLYFVHADAFPPGQFVRDIINAVQEGFPIGCYRFKFDSDRLLLRVNSYFTRFDRIMCRGGDQTLFVTRELFQALQGFREDHVLMEDYDIIIRARKDHRFKILNGDVIISARKYHENSYLRVNVANFTVFALYFAGVRPARLLNLYKKMIKHPKSL